jgi:hypothetical protein
MYGSSGDPLFNVIEGKGSAAKSMELRAQGRVLAVHVENPVDESAEQLLARWRTPFEDTLGGELPGYPIRAPGTRASPRRASLEHLSAVALELLHGRDALLLQNRGDVDRVRCRGEEHLDRQLVSRGRVLCGYQARARFADFVVQAKGPVGSRAISESAIIARARYLQRGAPA